MYSINPQPMLVYFGEVALQQTLSESLSMIRQKINIWTVRWLYNWNQGYELLQSVLLYSRNRVCCRNLWKFHRLQHLSFTKGTSTHTNSQSRSYQIRILNHLSTRHDRDISFNFIISYKSTPHHTTTRYSAIIHSSQRMGPEWERQNTEHDGLGPTGPPN